MNTHLDHGYHGGLRGRDPHDSRDWLYAPHARKFAAPIRLPEKALITALPPVGDQGKIGSCTAWATVCAREILTLKAGHQRQPLSPLWVYYETRRRFWDVAEDSGAYLRDAARILAGRGAALEEEWPYEQARWRDHPPAGTYAKALWYRNVAYYRLSTLREMLECLAAGYPFTFGFPVHANFWDSAAGTGIVPMPKGPEQGGHAVCAIGYWFDGTWPGGGYVIARNSWGQFTLDGNLKFPFDFMGNPEITWDVWAFRLRDDHTAWR